MNSSFSLSLTSIDKLGRVASGRTHRPGPTGCVGTATAFIGYGQLVAMQIFFQRVIFSLKRLNFSSGRRSSKFILQAFLMDLFGRTSFAQFVFDKLHRRRDRTDERANKWTAIQFELTFCGHFCPNKDFLATLTGREKSQNTRQFVAMIFALKKRRSNTES